MKKINFLLRSGLIMGVVLVMGSRSMPLGAEDVATEKNTNLSGIPHLLNFQGRLTDMAGMYLEGQYDITFRIYDAETEGEMIWEEVQEGVRVTNGIFSVPLGSEKKLDLDFDKGYWLSIEVEDDGEMSPRQQITSVGYAYRAETVNKGNIVYTGEIKLTGDSNEDIYLHLDGKVKGIRLYLWGERTEEDTYPDGVNIFIDGVRETDTILALANLNWGRSETKLGDGTRFHPLVKGVGTVTGTGEIDITDITNWTFGEHRLTFTQRGLEDARLRYSVYVKY